MFSVSRFQRDSGVSRRAGFRRGSTIRRDSAGRFSSEFDNSGRPIPTNGEPSPPGSDNSRGARQCLLVHDSGKGAAGTRVQEEAKARHQIFFPEH